MTLRTVVIVPARDEEDRLAATLHGLETLPGVLRLLVVDDGSRDATAEVARKAGAQTVPSAATGRPAGKGRALLTGLSLARRETPAPDAVLFADADLGASARWLSALIEALDADHPAAIAAFPPTAATGGGFGLVKRHARRAIASRNSLGYVPAEPLSGQRALLTPVLDDLPGIAPGFGAEVGMTLDLLGAGIAPRDVPIPLSHRPTGRTLSGFYHRGRQGFDILRALKGARLPW